MSVYRRGGVWWVTISLNGQRIRASAGPGATKAQAQELEAKIRTDAHAGRVGRPTQRTLDDGMIKWLKTDAVNLKSYDNLRNKSRTWLPYISGQAITDAPKICSQATADWLKAGLKPATINRRLAIIRRICNLAYKNWQWIDLPVADRIKPLPGEQARHHYLTPDQVEALASHCTHPEAARAIKLAAYTGLRRAELLGLTATNINPANDTVTLGSNTKSGRPRQIPLPEFAQAIIRPLPLQLTEAILRKQFNRARQQADLPHIRYHDLRHTYASWLVQSGATLAVVRDLLGHSSLAVTSRYAHLADDHLRDAVSKIGQAPQP